MSPAKADYSAVIDAPPEAVYAVISDYRVGHPAILPKPYFEEMIVVEGGQGAGTLINLHMSVFGKSYHYRQVVSEPKLGRIIEEKDLDTGQTTTFTIDPVADGTKTRVTITSFFPTRAGIMGMIERLSQPLIARHIYKQELQNLADYLKTDARRQVAAS